MYSRIFSVLIDIAKLFSTSVNILSYKQQKAIMDYFTKKNIFLIFYLFIFRNRGRERQRERYFPHQCEREISISGPNPQPRHVS